jgi:hypothetical protein
MFEVGHIYGWVGLRIPFHLSPMPVAIVICRFNAYVYSPTLSKAAGGIVLFYI